MTLNEVLRQERKFLITQEQAKRIEKELCHFLKADIHNGPNGYIVRSLYFDTLDDRDFWDKMGGYAQRRKLRMRIYSIRDPFAMLELKQKDGSYQRKRSLKLKRWDAAAVCKGDYSPLLRYKEPFAAECYGLIQMLTYSPRAVIQYHRTAYIGEMNNIRVTFDNDIRSAESSKDLYADPYLGAPVLPGFHTVLEVKYNRFLPSFVRKALLDCNQSEISVSKYCLGRIYNLHAPE